MAISEPSWEGVGMRFWGRTSGVAAILAFASASQAIIAYSNFGIGDTYSSTGLVVRGSSFSPRFDLAMQFVAGATGVVSSIRTAIFNSTGSDHALRLVLHEDNGSNGVGTTIGFWDLTSPDSPGIVSITNSDGSISLTSGSTYWLELKAMDAATNVGWNLSNSDTGNRARSNDGGATWIYPAGSNAKSVFEVNVSPTSVPEPFTMALMGSAAVAGYLRIRRKQA